MLFSPFENREPAYRRWLAIRAIEYHCRPYLVASAKHRHQLPLQIHSDPYGIVGCADIVPDIVAEIHVLPSSEKTAHGAMLAVSQSEVREMPLGIPDPIAECYVAQRRYGLGRNSIPTEQDAT